MSAILGLGSSAIGTLVERTTRFTMLLHLPRMDEHGQGPREKNGPPLAGHGAEAVRDAIAITITITTQPDELRRSLTWDKERRWRNTPGYASKQGWISTSAIRAVRSNAGPTKTLTGCFASTFPRAPRPSTNIYYRFKKLVLRRLLELGQSSRFR